MILLKRKTKPTEFIKNNSLILIIIVISVIWSIRIFSNVSIKDYHFVYLASAFLEGKLHFDECVIPGDLAFFQGKYYVV